MINLCLQEVELSDKKRILNNINNSDILSLSSIVRFEDQSLIMLSNMITSDDPSPEDICIDLDSKSKLSSWAYHIMMILSSLEKRIVEERILSDNPLTYENLGRIFGCSEQVIENIEKRAIAKMRKAVCLRFPFVINKMNDNF
jgi:DNA-directed RNA polymerase sigma subunit (sigma70/sigma32)